ncbi:MAG TPA: ATPase, T2SS/T4P/T4SS family [Opitutaceae bacterium]
MSANGFEMVLAGQDSRGGGLLLPPALDGSNGFLITTSEIVGGFVEHFMYPAQLAAMLDAEAAKLFYFWLKRSRQPFRQDELPWLPIGRVGPLLVLGHVKVGLSNPPLSWGTFQPVLLRREDYERHLAHVAALFEGWAIHEPDSTDIVFGAGRFPSTLIMPTDRRNALIFLSQYYHRPAGEAALLENVLADRAVPEMPLPAGYIAAEWFLRGQGAVAQPANLRLSEPTQRKVPEALRKRVVALFELEGHLWCAASALPPVEIEDRLYAELGEGWTLHWLLRASDQSPLVESSSLTSSVTPAASKIILPTTAGARGSRQDVIEAEERLISLEEKDWQRFDPRHRDSAAPESLWKWAVFKALCEGSTDLHIEPGAQVTRIRHRLDGLLEEMLEVPTSVGEAMVYSLMTQVGLGSDKYRPIDGSFQIELLSKDASRAQSVRVRASAYPIRGVTQKIALRFLPRQGAVPALESLLPPKPFRYLSRAISRTEGLVLVCGPTGSGKTTTLFSALASLNRSDVNVTTLENPVEILLAGVNQAEVNDRREVTWANLNRAFLRQDPDVGLIGEIRDEDTAQTILRAALTGHLVFGSLHTKSCATSIIRMTDLGADPNMLAESLILVVSQRLIRRVCEKCRGEAAPSLEEKVLFGRHGVPLPERLSRVGAHARDCEHCRGRGFRGRVAAVEVLPNVPAIRQKIEERAVSQAYDVWMHEHQLPTVFENALELAAAGVTTVSEALTLQDAWDGADWAHLL